MSLRKQSISAFFWASGQQTLALILNLTFSILLARVLNPEEFGLIGMISIFIALGRVLMSGGLADSLIQSQETNQIDYSTVFFTNVIFSIVIYVIIFFVAPYVSVFFEREELISILRIYGLVVLIFPLNLVQFVLLTKALNFKKTLAIRIPSIIVGGITGMLMALNGFGVWSLVGMYLIQALSDTLQLWLKSVWRPSMIFSVDSFNKHISFGSKITAANMLNAIFQNIYNIAIGKLFSAQILGFYTRSQTLANLPVYNLQEILDNVTFPLLSKIQNDTSKMRETFKNIFYLITIVITPILLFSIIISEPLFRFFLTEKWLPAVPYFRLICLGGVFIPLVKNNLNILKALGKSSLMLRLNLFEKLILISGFSMIFPFGIYGILYFQIGAFFLSFLVNAYFSGKYIGYGMLNQLMDFLNVFMMAIIPAAFAGTIFYYTNNEFNDLSTLTIAFISYFSLYYILVKIFYKSFYSMLLNEIKSKLLGSKK